jgi:hypothetical protein
LPDVLVPCIGVKYQKLFLQSEHRGFVKWEHNYIQNRRKTGVLAEEASDLMKRFFATKGDDI